MKAKVNLEEIHYSSSANVQTSLDEKNTENVKLPPAVMYKTTHPYYPTLDFKKQRYLLALTIGKQKTILQKTPARF